MIKLVDFVEYQDEIMAMMMEMAHLEPYDLNIQADDYIKLQEMGVLLPFLWIGDDIKGVALLFKSPSLRNPDIIDVSTDVIWVKPQYRFGSHVFINGIKKQLKKMDVDYWVVSSRVNAPIDGFLMALDFKPLERVFYQKL